MTFTKRVTFLPNCAPSAINPGLVVTPPATERLSRRAHFTETAPAFPKQKLKTIPIPRDDALTGSVISVTFLAFLVNSIAGPMDLILE